MKSQGKVTFPNWSNVQSLVRMWEGSLQHVTNLQGPPLERTPEDKIRDLKSLAQQYARDLGSHDGTQISYLEFVESEVEADLMLARMIAG
jgi:hypothetical protein